MTSLKELGIENIKEIKSLFAEVFTTSIEMTIGATRYSFTSKLRY